VRVPLITRLTQIGRLPIALRIAQGLTVRELVKRLGISGSLVSRDERNE
jgi:transcriptional regulator with XRE-family HTH domain